MNSSIQFREFEPEDAVYCQFIRRATFFREFLDGSPGLELWESVDEVPPAEFGQLLRTLRVFVAVRDDYVCGFCALRMHDAGIAEVALLYIKSDMRDLALDSALLRYSEMALAAELPQVEVFTATVAKQSEASWRAEGYDVCSAMATGILRGGLPTFRVRKYSRSRIELSTIPDGTVVCG